MIKKNKNKKRKKARKCNRTKTKKERKEERKKEKKQNSQRLVWIAPHWYGSSISCHELFQFNLVGCRNGARCLLRSRRQCWDCWWHSHTDDVDVRRLCCFVLRLLLLGTLLRGGVYLANDEALRRSRRIVLVESPSPSAPSAHSTAVGTYSCRACFRLRGGRRGSDEWSWLVM